MTAVLLLTALGLWVVALAADPWITIVSVDLNSGDYKIDQLLFGHSVSSRVRATKFSDQVRRYVNPPAAAPHWNDFSEHHRFSGEWDAGTPIGPRCNDIAGWPDIDEADAAKRKAVLARCAKDLVNQDEDAITKELETVQNK